MPNVAIATAMASSKLLPAAVNARVVARSYPSLMTLPSRKDPAHMAEKYNSNGTAIRATSSGLDVMARPCNENSTTIVKDRKSTRLNSSHVAISYAVFCLKKKKKRNKHRKKNHTQRR